MSGPTMVAVKAVFKFNGAHLKSVVRPEDQYHEDFGDVLWWSLDVGEPPYVGSPRDDDFPTDHVTHWTPLLVPLFPFNQEELK